MILKSLNLSNEEQNKKKTILVPVPQWGEGAEIMVTEMTVAGYIRRNNLTRVIFDMKDIDDIRRTGLLMCADLLSTMVHPETGDFLLPETDLDKFHATVNKDSLDDLLTAQGTLNPPKAYVDMESKKKPS